MLAAPAATPILLVVRDPENKPLPGFRFAYGGVESQPTNKAGATALDLPSVLRGCLISSFQPC
jgi:hypothetical protein